MKDALRQKEIKSATVQPKQEKAQFSVVAIPRQWWNKWNNCGNSKLQQKKGPM